MAERFIRTLEKKNLWIYDFNIKNAYIDKLADIVNEYSNTYHSAIKLKPVDIKSSTYIDFVVKNNEGRKYTVVNHVRISKYKSNFAKGYILNWSKEVFLISVMLLVILTVKKLLEGFMKKDCKKQIKKNLE